MLRQILLSFIASILFTNASLGQAGTLDVTFSGDGKLTADIGTDDLAFAVKVQPDGKIIVAGYSYNGASLDNDYTIIRYNPDGTLDNTFGGDGIVTTDFDNRNDRLTSIAIQPDGKIVVVGYTYNGDYDIGLARYLSDGTLDATFDGDGKLITDTGGNHDDAQSVVIQGDGKILVGSTSNFLIDGNDEYTLLRYNADGSLDDTFAGDGIQTTDFYGADDYVMAVVLQPDGKIVAAGKAQNGTYFDIAVGRYNADGSLDNTFSTDGITSTSLGVETDEGFSVALQSDGKIVIGGFYYNGLNHDFIAVRFQTDGTLDNTFDGDGKVSTAVGTDYDLAYSLTLQPDDKILLAGFAYKPATDNDFAIVRYNTDGSLDNTFSGDGKVTTPFGESTDEAYAIAMQPDGKIVVAGATYDGSEYHFAVARYLSGLDVSCIDYIVLQPVSVIADAGSDINFITGSSNPETEYQWQVNEEGVGWVNVLDGGQYAGATNDTLIVSNLILENDGLSFRCLMNFDDCPDTSFTALLTVQCGVLVADSPESLAADEGDDVMFISQASEPDATYQWQMNEGAGWLNIVEGGQFAGTTNDTLFVSELTSFNDDQTFRSIINFFGCIDTTGEAILTVNQPIAIADMINNADMIIYPNPANESIQLYFPSAVKIQSISTHNYLGEKVELLFDSNYKAFISEIKPGIYITTITTEAGKISKKWVKL